LGDDTIRGLGGADQLFGDPGNDLLDGGADSDKLFGGPGDDYLRGGEGADTLYGGPGRDRLLGADLIGADDAQVDIFRFRSAAEAGKAASRDVILYFVSGEDVIDLNPMDAKSGSGNQDFKFIGKAGFHHIKGELRYQKAGADMVVLQGDINGDGKADFEIEVRGVTKIAPVDLILDI
jgi:Ca2+-binding RTX toxin-like protein